MAQKLLPSNLLHSTVRRNVFDPITALVQAHWSYLSTALNTTDLFYCKFPNIYRIMG